MKDGDFDHMVKIGNQMMLEMMWLSEMDPVTKCNKHSSG